MSSVEVSLEMCASRYTLQQVGPRSGVMLASVDPIAEEAGKGATEMLMRGFTSARENGGPVFGLKRAIDEGMFPVRASRTSS